MMKTALFPRLGGVLFLGCGLLMSGGCGSSVGPRDLMMEEASAGPVERPVAMKGEVAFLEGKVAALATVSRGFDRGPGAGRAGERRRGGMFGKEDEAGAFSENYNIYGDSEEEQKEAMAEYIRVAKARRAAGSPMPPVTLRVQFENKGTEPIELEITEVNSDLGNFAVRPPKLTLAPGAKGTLEPMISQLGVTNDEIPLKLSVRSAGKRETQVVLVKSVLRDSVKKDFEAQRK